MSMLNYVTGEPMQGTAIVEPSLGVFLGTLFPRNAPSTAWSPYDIVGDGPPMADINDRLNWPIDGPTVSHHPQASNDPLFDDIEVPDIHMSNATDANDSLLSGSSSKSGDNAFPQSGITPATLQTFRYGPIPRNRITPHGGFAKPSRPSPTPAAILDSLQSMQLNSRGTDIKSVVPTGNPVVASESLEEQLASQEDRQAPDRTFDGSQSVTPATAAPNQSGEIPPRDRSGDLSPLNEGIRKRPVSPAIDALHLETVRYGPTNSSEKKTMPRVHPPTPPVNSPTAGAVLLPSSPSKATARPPRYGPVATRSLSLGPPLQNPNPRLPPLSILKKVIPDDAEHDRTTGQPLRYGPVPTRSVSRRPASPPPTARQPGMRFSEDVVPDDDGHGVAMGRPLRYGPQSPLLHPPSQNLTAHSPVVSFSDDVVPDDAGDGLGTEKPDIYGVGAANPLSEGHQSHSLDFWPPPTSSSAETISDDGHLPALPAVRFSPVPPRPISPGPRPADHPFQEVVAKNGQSHAATKLRYGPVARKSLSGALPSADYRPGTLQPSQGPAEHDDPQMSAVVEQLPPKPLHFSSATQQKMVASVSDRVIQTARHGGIYSCLMASNHRNAGIFALPEPVDIAPSPSLPPSLRRIAVPPSSPGGLSLPATDLPSSTPRHILLQQGETLIVQSTAACPAPSVPSPISSELANLALSAEFQEYGLQGCEELTASFYLAGAVGGLRGELHGEHLDPNQYLQSRQVASQKPTERSWQIIRSALLPIMWDFAQQLQTHSHRLKNLQNRKKSLITCLHMYDDLIADFDQYLL